MNHIQKTVFISYRRENIPWALAIYQDLTRHGYDVFIDYENIASGDFEQLILGNIRARAHFLVLLTPSALERTLEPGDWLRREIETALDTKRNIVPLMFEGFDFDSPAIAKYLSGKLAQLKSYNALPIHAEYFQEGMQRLRGRFLNVALEDVLHPLSGAASQVALAQQSAASSATAVSQDELSAQAWFEKGYTQAQTGQVAQAIHSFNEAIRLQPGYANAYYNRGLARQKQGDLEGAAADFDQAIRLKPQLAAAPEYQEIHPVEKDQPTPAARANALPRRQLSQYRTWIILALIALAAFILAYFGWRFIRQPLLIASHATQTAAAMPLPTSLTGTPRPNSTATLAPTFTSTATPTLFPSATPTLLGNTPSATITPAFSLIKANCLAAGGPGWTYYPPSSSVQPVNGCWNLTDIFPIADGALQMERVTLQGSGEQQRGIYIAANQDLDVSFKVKLNRFTTSANRTSNLKNVSNMAFGITRSDSRFSYIGVYLYYYAANPPAFTSQVQVVREDESVDYNTALDFGNQQPVKFSLRGNTLRIYLGDLQQPVSTITLSFPNRAFYIGYRLLEKSELNAAITDFSLK
jgi:tetratricopeptide (TPR) repeat protein